jgi:hypothetical protein
MAPLTIPSPDVVTPDDAYEVFWHAAEDDVRVTSFDADEAETLSDADDVYFAFVSAVEA